jgi:hypothetical protein
MWALEAAGADQRPPKGEFLDQRIAPADGNCHEMPFRLC